MKLCNTEAMKLIKEYEEQKRLIVDKEDNCARTSYREGEQKLTNDYDYEQTRKEVADLDEKVRRLRVQLQKANCTVLVEGFGITICEALILLAQLQNERGQIESLVNKKQIDRRITPNGVIEYTECLYDVQKAKADVEELRKKISELQMAIDRANLTNYFEV